LRQARPNLPEELSDRQADVSEPLLAIADAAGGEWPERARRALIELCAQAQAADDSIGVRLLADIREIFKERAIDRIASAELVKSLADIETSPWSEWTHDKPLTPSRLARLLKPFEITPAVLRVGDNTPRGYLIGQFLDTFERYLPAETMMLPPSPPPQSATPQQAAIHAGSSEFSNRNTKNDVAVQKRDKSNRMSDVADVAVSNPPMGAGGELGPPAEGESAATPKPLEVDKQWRF
jgi:hypothetical protein